MKNSIYRIGALAVIVLMIGAVASVSFAGDVIKADNEDNLNTGTSWEGGSVPGTGDVGVWDSTVTGANSVQMGGNFTWQGLRIEDPGGDVTVNGNNTMTLTSVGMDLGSVRNLTFTSGISLQGPLSGSTTLTLDSNYTKNWTSMANVNFTGALVLRGGSAAAGSYSDNWLAFGNPTLSQTGAFSLDTGAALDDRGEFIITDAWGDGSSKPKLSLTALSGYGDFRSDWGDTGGRTISVDSADTNELQGRIIQHNSTLRSIHFEKLGSGTQILSGANSYQNTIVGEGKLQIGNGGSTGNIGLGTVSIAAGAELIFNRSNAFTVSSTIAGEGFVTKTGAGRMSVNGDNSGGEVNWRFAGSGNGDIGFSNANAIGDSNSTITVEDGGTGSVFLAGTGNSSDVAISIGSGATFSWNGSTGNQNTLSGSISGSGTFSKLSGEHLILTGSSSHTGDISITGGGILELGGSGNLGGGSYAGDVSVGSANLFKINATSDQTFSGVISGAGNFTKDNSGTSILTGNNDYTGATTISSGKLQVGNGASSGSIGSAGVGGAGNAVTVESGATLEFNRTGLLDYKANPRMRHVAGGGDIVIDGGVKLWNYTGSSTGFDDANSWNNFSGRLIVKGGSEFQTIRNGRTAMGTADVILGDATTSGKLSQIEGNWTWTNDIQLQGSANEIINNATGSGRWNKLQGVISGDGNLSFKDSTGAVNNGNLGFILTGENTAAGTITVDTFVRVGGVTGDSISLSAGTGGTLGSASVVINSGKRLTFSRSDTHTVANSISGDGELYIGSTGISDSDTQVLTLSGSNTHAGGTVVAAGTLNLSGSVSSGIVVESGATLTGNGAITGGLTMNAESTLDPGSSPGTMSVSGDVSLDGASVLIDIWGLGGAGAVDGHDQISISEGALILSNTPTITVDLNSVFNPELNSQFTIISGIGSWQGSWSGTVSVVNAPAAWEQQGKSFRIDQGSVMLTVIPEPNAVALILMALLSLTGLRLRRRSR